ncbi:MAG: AI-2E family transporter [Archangium sp.]|nr:AI-2E family transporter [Archangium sp.]
MNFPTSNVQRFQWLVITLAVVMLGIIVWPIATPLFFGAVLAGSLYPAHVRLTRRLRNRPRLSAALLTLSALIGVVGPFVILVALGITQASRVAAMAEAASKNGSLDAAIARLPGVLHGAAWALVDRVPNVAELVSSSGLGVALTLTNVARTTGHLLLVIALTFISMFFLLNEGRSLIGWFDALLPMPTGQFHSILAEFRKVSRSVLLAVGATAAVQATTGLIGLLIAQVPNPFFFTLLAFVLALIPLVGAASCFVVLGLGYLAIGATGTGLFLIAWGVFAVGVIDNLLRPIFIGDGTAMHGGLVFFSLIGGLAAFGTAGLVAGPLTVAFFIAVMRVENIRRHSLHGVPPAPAQPPEQTGT